MSPVNSGTEKEVQPEWRVGAMGVGIGGLDSGLCRNDGWAGWRLGRRLGGSATWLVSVEGLISHR